MNHDQAERMIRGIERILAILVEQTPEQPTVEDEQRLRGLFPCEPSLSARAGNVLLRDLPTGCGYERLGDLRKLDRRTLRCKQNCGGTTVQEICTWAENYDIFIPEVAS